MPRRPPLTRWLPVAAAVAATAAGAAACSSHTVSVVPPVPSGPVQFACAHLGDALPANLEKLHSRVVRPHSPLTHAWGTPPVVLRCGVPTPAAYRKGSAETTVVNGVEWFQQVATSTVTWTAVRSSATIELVVPASYEAQGPFLVDLATAVKQVP